MFGLAHRRNNRRTSSSYTEKYTAEVAEIRDDIYVDDLSSGGENLEQMTFLQDIAIEMFRESGFRLNKWHSNVTTLEQKELVNGTNPTFAKQQLVVKLNDKNVTPI